MGRQLIRWEWGGAIFTAIMGTLLHFAYEWSGGNPLAAVVGSVNESIWEHMKLLFVPVFVWSVVQLWFHGRNYPNFLAARTAAVLVGLALIPVLYYTYTGVLGRQIDWVNILIFFLAVAAMFLLDYRLLISGWGGGVWQQVVGLVILWALAFCFVYCTFYPVELPLWQDPVTGGYGIP